MQVDALFVQILSAVTVIAATFVGLMIRSAISGLRISQEHAKMELLLQQTKVKEELIMSQFKAKEDITNNFFEIRQEFKVHSTQDELRFKSIDKSMAKIDESLQKIIDIGVNK